MSRLSGTRIAAARVAPVDAAAVGRYVDDMFTRPVSGATGVHSRDLISAPGWSGKARFYFFALGVSEQNARAAIRHRALHMEIRCMPTKRSQDDQILRTCCDAPKATPRL
jgi:hypothetical protein